MADRPRAPKNVLNDDIGVRTGFLVARGSPKQTQPHTPQ